jgi:hypothetical protein
MDFVRSLPSGVMVFYSRLAVSPESHYARKQNERFGGYVAIDEMICQTEVFERELGATEYLFVPM